MSISDWKSKAVSPLDAVKHLKSHDKIFVHGASATPTTLLDAMVQRKDLEGVKLYHLHLSGPLTFVEPEYTGKFFSISL